MKCRLTAIVMVGAIFGGILDSSLKAAVPVVWDGSDTFPDYHVIAPGYLRWEEGNWTKDGTPGQTASATMGDSTGGRGGYDIVIGNGAKVFHDQNDSGTDPGALGDFKPRMDLGGPGSLTIKEGSTLWLDAHTDVDGRWARMDINVNLDNGILRTTHTPALCPPSECSASAGRIIFGYNNDLLPNTVLEWNLTNGARIEMEGKMTWGNPNYWEESSPGVVNDNPQTGHNPGIGMNMTINNGTLDLTGGRLYDDFFGLVNGEMVFFYERVGPNTVGAPLGPKNEQYSINFTGPGQIIVDSGIHVAEQDVNGAYQPKNGLAASLYESVTYQELWQLGILKANGQSGLTGATFSDYFTVSGSPDEVDEFGSLVVDNNNYTLTSLLAPPGQDGDHNEDGFVNAADYPAWRKLPTLFGGDPGGYNEWRANFGEGGAGGSGAVPEPVSLVSVMIGLASLWFGRRRLLH